MGSWYRRISILPIEFISIEWIARGGPYACPPRVRPSPSLTVDCLGAQAGPCGAQVQKLARWARRWLLSPDCNPRPWEPAVGAGSAASAVRGGAEDVQGDVVGASAFPGEADQLGASGVGLKFAHDFQNFVLVDQAPEAIGAEHEHVPVFKDHGAGRRFGVDLAACAEGGGEDVALGMAFSLVGVKDAGLDQAADVGMVAGEAGNGASANQVEPAVTDVRHVEAVVVERERGASGAHAVELGVGFGVAADAGVGFLKPFQERGAGVPGGVVVINVLDGLDGEAAGFLAAFVSTHPVGDEGQSSLLLESLVTLGLPVGKRILIVFALAAHVAQAGDFDSRTNLHTPLGGNLAWTARHETAVTPLPPRARTGPRLRGHPPVCPAWPDDYKRTCGLRVPGNKY